MTADTVIALYQHGALVCAAIVAVYLLLRWGVGHVPWLEQPQHAHYATIAVTVIGVFAVPAAAGQMPSLNMALAALGTLGALMLPGVAPQKTVAASLGVAPSVLPLAVAQYKARESGRARLTLMACLGLAAMIGAALLSACQHGTYTKMSGAFKACEKADLGQDVAPGITVIGDVAGKIEGNAPNLEADLTALALKVGVQSVDCAIAAVEAVIGNPTSGAKQTGEPTPADLGMRRADAWMAAHP